MTEAPLDRLAAALGDAGLDPRAEQPVGPMTTYRVGGRAALAVEPADGDQLAAVARIVTGASADQPVAVLVVGNGSNLLVADAGFPGLVIHLGAGFEQVTVADDQVTVRAGGAAPLPIVARRTAALGLTGFEWAVGVPGTIGGAVRMNAGGHGSDMAAVLTGVRVVDLVTGDDEHMAVSQLRLGYRQSSVRSSQVVVEATLGLAAGDRAAAEAEITDIVRWRREHQPGGANAGSVFTNPEGDSAGRLIDAAGAKGLRVGTAQVSDKHANFIQADASGSADDIVALMAEVRRRVLDHSGVALEPETHLIGFDAAALAGVGR